MGARVTVTDLSEFIDLMRHNVDSNVKVIQQRQGVCHVLELVWGVSLPTLTLPTLTSDCPKPSLILLADCIYYEESLEPLVKTMVSVSSQDTLIICCHEHRTTDNKPRLQKQFFEEVSKHFRVTRIPTILQHPVYSSDDIHIHIFRLHDQPPS
ncbi:VCPKMT [Bugula neritina]|uniref:VCPKMT n=1 Tax=Bugula neritina TaxID=10212 RepID=A0A7J7KN00_BUGNE|nr:VCPKMT [Bugula neritina]